MLSVAIFGCFSGSGFGFRVAGGLVRGLGIRAWVPLQVPTSQDPGCIVYTLKIRP